MAAIDRQAKALAGIRVVDFCHGGVGPLTTKFLADAGAQTIKVESHVRTEVIRRAPPFKQGVFHIDGSAVFASANNNKLGITLNLKEPKAIELAKRLIAISDVVADSFTPGVMQRLGLGYEELKKVKPDIIQISMSLAGESGPYAHQRGHGGVLMALLGIPGQVGWEDGPPLSPAGAFSDYYLPQIWTVAVMDALIHRDATGEGQFIDASDFEGAFDLMDTGPLAYVANGYSRPRLGNRHEWAVPHGCYKCQGEDRWCVISVFEDAEWQALCRVIGTAVLGEDRFATFAGRKQHEDELDRLIEAWTVRRGPGEVMRLLQEVGVAAAVVQNMAEVIADPQVQHRRHYWELDDDPDREWFTYETEGFQLSTTPISVEKGRPLLGEDNYYVFHEVMGISDGEIAALIADGVIE